MVQRFEDWCREWKGPPYASLEECVREQHASAINLFREAIAGSLAPPTSVFTYATLEWLGALVTWPGKQLLLGIAASSPDAIYLLGIERDIFDGWIPFAISAAVYALGGSATTAIWRRRRTWSPPP